MTSRRIFVFFINKEEQYIQPQILNLSIISIVETNEKTMKEISIPKQVFERIISIASEQ